MRRKPTHEEICTVNKKCYNCGDYMTLKWVGSTGWKRFECFECNTEKSYQHGDG